jgi:DNA-binding protein YbaB
MLDQFKAMGALAGLMKDKDRLREISERVRTRLEETRVEGRAGGGAVRVEVSGVGEVLGVHVEPAIGAGFADAESRDAAQLLIAEAVNDGLTKAKQAAQSIVESEAEELGLGDMLPKLRGLLPT